MVLGRRLWAAMGLAVASACSDGPVAPSGDVVAIELSVPTAMVLGQDATVTVIGHTVGGGSVSWGGPLTLELRAEERAHAPLQVVTLQGTHVLATGPGLATLVASVTVASGSLHSEPVVVSVARQPIVTRVEPAAVGPAGGPVALIGYDLADVTNVLVDGTSTAVSGATDGRAELLVPPAPEGCVGRAAVGLTVPGAHAIAGPLRVARPRPGDVALQPGELRRLGAAADLCLRLGAVAGAEYALLMFDTRGIRAAEAAPEPVLMAYETWSLQVRDVTAGPTVASSAPAATASPPGAAAGWPEPHRLPHAAGAARPAGPPPSDLIEARATPWTPGETFSVQHNGEYLAGRIIHATERFAVGVLDRDAAYSIPSRIQGMEAAVALYDAHADALLRQALLNEFPASSSGSAQIVVLVADWGFTGGFHSFGSGTQNPGNYVGLDPGVAVLPSATPLIFDGRVLVHEMVHAYQDRYWNRQCVDLGECSYSAWNYRWAVEGVAELFTEHVMAEAQGFSFDGNSDHRTLSNVFGVQTYYGDTYHYGFTDGYASSSWLLRDMVHRMVAAGADRVAAFGAVARGAFEGWYGIHQDAVLEPGLAGRLREVLGAEWSPREGTLLALAAVAVDDLTGELTLQVPLVRNAWELHKPAAQFQLGGSATVAGSVRGNVYAHYRVRDEAGLGGAMALSTDGPDPDWAVVRIR